MRLVGILATLVFAVCGSAIASYTKIAVLEEKIIEQKSEIKSLNQYIADTASFLEERIAEHKH